MRWFGIHPALWMLTKLIWWGGVRMVYRRANMSWRKTLFFGIGLLLIAVWFGATVVFFVRMWQPAPPVARTVVSLVVLGSCVLSLLIPTKTIVFAPSEVYFLLAGPFTRRELLLYRIANGAMAALVAGLFFSVWLASAAPSWITAYVSCFLALLFISLFRYGAFMIHQTVAKLAYTRFRKVLVLTVLVLAATGIAAGLSDLRTLNLAKAHADFRSSWAGTCLLAPFDVFGRALTAETVFPDFVAWTALALLMNGVLLSLVLWLDTNYLELAVENSQRLYARLQRMRQGDALAALFKPTRRRWRIPRLPRFGGAGLIAWQQLTAASRRFGGIFVVAVPVMFCVAPILLFFGIERDSLLYAIMGITVFSALYLPGFFEFDFRSAMGQINLLKPLPFTSTTLALGQMLGPVLVAACLQLALIAGGFVLLADQWRMLVATLMLSVALAFFHVGVVNFVFLLLPSRTPTSAAAIFEHFGRGILLFILRLTLSSVVWAIAIGAAALAFFVSRSWFVALMTALHVVALAAVTIIPCVAWAFERFDPSVDMPA